MLGAGGAALTIPQTNGGGFEVKDWWRKWSYDIPLAFGDALWEILVVQFAAFLDRLTIRKVIEFVLIAVLAMAFAQTFPFDLAILFAGDTLMYLEFAIAIRLAAGRIHFQQILRLALRLARFAVRVLNAIRQPVARLSRLRERRDARAAKPRRISDSPDDDRSYGMPWGALATA
jgi:hypothetical protein